jgi:hypothetical protein
VVLAGIALVASPASADDGPTGSVSVTASGRFGPIPEELAFGRVDGAVGRTWWHRLHAGAEVGLGAGGHASWFAEAMADAGAWLHASERLDVLIGWRVGYAHFNIRGVPVGAVAGEFVADLRFRVRSNLDVRFAPVVPTFYFSQGWHLMIGPELGAVMRF